MTRYEFSIIRYMHSYASGEWVNVGLAMLDYNNSHLIVKLNHRYSRISQFFQANFDSFHYRSMIRRLEDSFNNLNAKLRQEKGFFLPLRTLDINLPALLASVIPQDSSVFQCSPIGGGIVRDVHHRFDILFSEFVSRHEKPGTRNLRQESQIWSDFEKVLRKINLSTAVRPEVIGNNDYEYTFRGSFRNGLLNVIEPVSLDLQNSANILEKANNWVGRLVTLKRNSNFAFNAIVAPPTIAELRPSFDRARRLLTSQRGLIKHLIVEGENTFEYDELFSEIRRSA